MFEIFPSKYNYDELLAAAEPLDAVDYARSRAFKLLWKLDDRLVSEAIPILLHEAGLAINERRNYRQAAQLLAKLQEIFRAPGETSQLALKNSRPHMDITRTS